MQDRSGLTQTQLSVCRLRLDDGSTVTFKPDRGASTIGNLGYSLAYGPNSVGGQNAVQDGFRYFADQWHIPTEDGLVPVSRVVEYLDD